MPNASAATREADAKWAELLIGDFEDSDDEDKSGQSARRLAHLSRHAAKVQEALRDIRERSARAMSFGEDGIVEDEAFWNALDAMLGAPDA